MKPMLGMLVVVMLASSAHATDAFSARVQRARRIEDSPSGKAYQTVLWKKVGRYTASVMSHCFPKGAKPDTASFTVVANVMHDHTVSHIEVRPRTKMTQCFVDGFRRASFPLPPKAFEKQGMPIEMDITVTP